MMEQTVGIAASIYWRGWEEWRLLWTELARQVTGKHDVYFAFTGNKRPKLFNFDWWRFER